MAPVIDGRSIVMVGSSYIAQEVRVELQEEIQVQCDPLLEGKDGECIWGRDARVILLDGSHLVPYAIQAPFLEDTFKALLPESSSHFLNTCSKGFGLGVSEKYVKNTHKIAKDLGIVSIQAKTCIEGGNCFLGEKGAIVGIHSVVLSFIGLEEQGFFDHQTQQVVDEPKEFFIRMARNRGFFNEKAKVRAQLGGLPFGKWSETDYRARLKSPLTKRHQETYELQAKELESKWALTLNVMAEELRVDLGKLVIVEHTAFHIDMEMALGPDNSLFMHDPLEADELVQTYRAQDAKFYEPYLSKSEALQKEMAIYKNNCKKLAPLGLEIVPVPAVYCSSNQNINLINGLFFKLQEKLYFFTSSSFRQATPLLDAFEGRLKARHIQPIFFSALGRMIREQNGGLHCLTWTRPVSASVGS